MTEHFKERSTRTYRQKQLFSKEELVERESLCVHEQSAFCAAACPMKLPAREFAADMAAGDFAAARQKLERVAPFPLILAHGCEAPCTSACRLNELPGGEGVDLPALERACMAHGAAKTGRGLLKFKKKKTAAVFGGELFTLVLAGEIERKSYPLTFFVSQPDAAALLRESAPFLSEADARSETERLLSMDIRIEYGVPLTPEFLTERRGDYDIVCALRALTGEPDETTLVNADGVVTRPEGAAPGVLSALWDARRAAASVDRLSQGLDPGGMRGEEGPTESRLYTDLGGAAPSKRVPENGVYTAEEAVAEAGRCIQCRCEECIKDCVYLRHFGKFPRILTREIYNNVDIIMGDHMMNRAINSCSLCGECKVACPNGYDVADVCLKARENMVSTDKLSLAVHEFALLDMLFSNGEAFLSRPQPGFVSCRYVFFPGCQAGAVAPETVRRAYLDLSARLPGGVGLMLGCCGAIARWAGRTELHREQTELLRAELHALGDPVVIAGCPTCRKELSELLGVSAVGVWDVLGEIGLPHGAEISPRRAVLHDSCAARTDREMQDSVRALAKKLGVELIETPNERERTTCCGYGGLVAYAAPEVASEMARDAAREPDGLYVTYCMACRDRFAREGRESAHLLELCYGSAGAAPDISEKRKNRLSLRAELLKEVWGEEMTEKDYGFKLRFTGEARAMMDQRMILNSDVWAVMEAYRQSGEAVLDQEGGELVTRARLGNVTFWVRFTEEPEGYLILRAYSHRMTIETR